MSLDYLLTKIGKKSTLQSNSLFGTCAFLETIRLPDSLFLLLTTNKLEFFLFTYKYQPALALNVL